MSTYEFPAIPKMEIEAATEDEARALHLEAVQRATSVAPVKSTDSKPV